MLKQWLQMIFGRRSDGDSNGISVYVRCAKCGEVVRVRINKGSDISRNDDDVLFVRKMAMDGKCHSRIEMELFFDDAYRITKRSIQGGEFVAHEQWMAQQNRMVQP
ncbi:MAG: hypothetical protein NTZ50_03635 [Chloroflexi bacterium]|nr:hypothetical protein [Chloroflexota bacterium]